jgi:hypothetical protein
MASQILEAIIPRVWGSFLFENSWSTMQPLQYVSLSKSAQKVQCIYRELAVPGHALLWPFPVTDWLDVFVPSRKNNPFTQPIVGLRSRWSSREYDDLSLNFCKSLSILACYTTVLYAPI